MSSREENICIYANGEIYETEEGDTFKCRRVKVVRVKSDITLDALKIVIGRKLRLNENQVVSELIYRHPLSLNPTRYKACEVEDDDDIQRMWEANARFPTQLSCPEVYAHISTMELDLNIASQPVDVSDPYTQPSTSQLHNINDAPSYYNPYPENVELINRQIGYEQQFHTPAVDCAPGPSFSPHNYGSFQSPSSPEETEDIMDEFEEEGAYDDVPEGFGGDNDSDDDDDGGEDVANTLPPAPVSQYMESAAAFFSGINPDAATSHDYPEGGFDFNMADTQEPYMGLRYLDQKSFRRAMKIYSIRTHHTFSVHYSSAKYEEYRCPHYGVQCNWRVRVCHRPRENQ